MNGLKKLWKKKVYITTITILSITATTSWPAQPSLSEEQNNQRTEEQSPDGEFLEFLGLFDDADTGWVDPIYLLETDDDFTGKQTPQEGKDEKR